MGKNESKSAQRKLGATSNGGSRKLLVKVLILGKNGVKMASPQPISIFFCKKDPLQNCVIHCYIFSLKILYLHIKLGEFRI